MSFLRLDNFPVSAATVTLPLSGRLVADLSLGTSGGPPVQPGDRVTLAFQTGVEYACAVERAAPRGGFSQVRVVGGTGGLSRSIPARYYEGIQAEQVVRDLLTECGETVGDINLPGTLTRWVRPEGLAHESLTALLLRYPGFTWRAGAGGRVSVGPETWPERREALPVTEIHPAAGVFTVPVAPDLAPGMLVAFQRGGEIIRKRVTRVEHRVGTTLQTLVFTGDGQDAGVEALGRLVGQATRFVDYLALYPAEILKDHGDHRLDLRPEHPLLPDLVRVPLVPPVPGSHVRVKAGGTCLLTFQQGDPARPIVLHLVDVTLERLEIRTGQGQVLLLDDDRGTTSDEGVYAAPTVALRDARGQGVTLDASQLTVSVRGSTRLSLDAAAVDLAGGGQAVARVGDPVQTPAGPGVIGPTASFRVRSG